jgi:hypothetical protein
MWTEIKSFRGKMNKNAAGNKKVESCTELLCIHNRHLEIGPHKKKLENSKKHSLCMHELLNIYTHNISILLYTRPYTVYITSIHQLDRVKHAGKMRFSFSILYLPTNEWTEDGNCKIHHHRTRWVSVYKIPTRNLDCINATVIYVTVYTGGLRCARFSPIYIYPLEIG